ncbi:hypothetical protein EDB84DRAFT_1278767 [Lactarius hengduanensis]|nr:hypothetical protein EDB84DRAFT_1278767 [Lactarius hengduanensis]
MRGRVHLIPSHPGVNGKANELFHQYQDQAADGKIQFHRWPLRGMNIDFSPLRGITNSDFGMPNNWRTLSVTICMSAPNVRRAPVVLGALHLIQHRIEMTLGMREDFNEVLSAAYMEEQKMTFHGNSECGLRPVPVVALLSLGCVAEMQFRLRSKYIVSDGHRKVAMSLILRHVSGTIITSNSGVQRYYEHAVVPQNFQIVATVRSISPENHLACQGLPLDR